MPAPILDVSRAWSQACGAIPVPCSLSNDAPVPSNVKVLVEYRADRPALAAPGWDATAAGL
jgi:hypothetical protein